MIYFLQSIDGGPIKIGFTDNFDARHKQLETHYRQPLALLATMNGGRDEEQAVHRRFAHLRFGRTEQFRPTVELMAFIGRPLLVDANPDTVEPMEASKDRLSVFSLKGSPEYRDWLNSLSDKSRIAVATIVRDSLAEWARSRGYPEPPEV